MDNVISEEAPVQKLDRNQIAREQAASVEQAKVAQAAQHVETRPDPQANFNSMASKLDTLLKETAQPKQAVVETKPEVKVEAKTEIKPETFTSPKAEDWKKVHSRVKELETKSTNLDGELKSKIAEIENLRKSAPDPKEMETLKSERDAMKAEREKLDEQLRVVALERHPLFDNHYTKLFTDSVTSAKNAVGNESAELIEHLINLPPSKQRKEQLNEIMELLPSEVDKQELATAFRDMDKARSERTAALADSKNKLKQIKDREEGDRSKQMESRKAMVNDRIEAVLKVAPSLDAFKIVEGNEEHNNQVKARNERVRRALSGELPDTEVSMMPALAEEALYLGQNIVPDLHKRISELENQIKQLGAGEPAGAAHGAAQSGSEQPKSFIDRFQTEWAGPQRK